MDALTAPSGKMQVVNTCTVKGEKVALLRVTEPGYFRGYLRGAQYLSKAFINNTQGETVKYLIIYPALEIEIFWLAEESGDYQLVLVTESSESTEVSLLLYRLALKQEQYCSPQEALLSPRLKQLKASLSQGIKGAEQRFWQQIEKQGSPLIEYVQEGVALLTFLYKGLVNNVRVLGSPNGGHTQLTHLEGSELWFHTSVVPSSTRLSYRVAPNVPQLQEEDYREQRRAVLATAQPDPLNQGEVFSKQDNLFGMASTITLKDAPQSDCLSLSGQPVGRIKEYEYGDNKYRRKITVYHPHHSYNISKQAPLLILFDGDAYLNKLPTTRIIDNLVAQGKIPAMRVLFFNQPMPSMREQELTPNTHFAEFLADEFMPWLCSELQINPEPQNRVLAGSSFGGLAATYIAFQHPDSFAKVLSLSGSFWWSPNNTFVGEGKSNWLVEQIAGGVKRDVQVYLSVGNFETEPEGNSLLATNKQMYQFLSSAGYQVFLDETASGHDYFNWQFMLAKGLTVLFNKYK